MINVLINAFAVGPKQGSEPGIGWEWITGIARYCNVFVICSDEYKDFIIKAYEQLPYKDNIVFTFNEISQKIVDIVNNQGDWRFYYYYRIWQKKSYEIAKQICKNNKIDIIHQLNLNN